MKKRQAREWVPQLAPLALALGLALVGTAARSQNVAGEVEFARGVGFAQTAGQTPRTLGRGLPLMAGDRLTTSDGASAIIKLQDGTRMTIRPNSELVLSQYQFKENAEDNSMVMQLFRGGLRAVTGLISKNSPTAARIQTNTATIGIRGTDFDARICARDCATEAQNVRERPRPNAVQASAKVVAAQGQVDAVDGNGQRRRLVDGGSIYPGDLVETGSGTHAVLAFRDDSRVTLGSTTRFRVDNFVYDDKNPGEGRFLTSLLRGSVRALTGLIARSNNRNVSFNTPTATIGVRGSGGDISCVDDDCTQVSVGTWQGVLTVRRAGDPVTSAQDVPVNAVFRLTPQGIVQVPASSLPTPTAPRPDQVTVPPKLFSSNNVAESEEGLYLFVRDGHIEVATAREVLHLGKGEAGLATSEGTTVRPESVPRFLDFDRMPLPTSRNPLLATVLGETGVRTARVCK